MKKRMITAFDLEAARARTGFTQVELTGAMRFFPARFLGAWDGLVPPAMEATVDNSNPAGRAGEHDELANLCAYLVSEQAACINGPYVTIDGGRWLQGAGMFSLLSRLGEAEGPKMRARQSS